MRVVEIFLFYHQKLLPLLEHSDFIHKYSWFISRYYEVSGSFYNISSFSSLTQEYDDSGWFW